jgi:hypothetical protein
MIVSRFFADVHSTSKKDQCNENDVTRFCLFSKMKQNILILATSSTTAMFVEVVPGQSTYYLYWKFQLYFCSSVLVVKSKFPVSPLTLERAHYSYVKLHYGVRYSLLLFFFYSWSNLHD